MIPREFARRIAALTQVHVSDPAHPELSDADDHHVRRVLRAHDGDEIVVTDGAGRWAMTCVRPVGLELVSVVETEPSPPAATLYLAPLKGDRSEWAVTKATELGVTAVVPLLAAHVVVATRGAALERALARWRRVAAAAASQCRRTHDLVIGAPVRVADVPAAVAVAEFEGVGDLNGVTAIAIGPEGGWADGEWDDGRVRLGLGGTVLRGDTAAVAAATLLVSVRDGWSRRTGARGVGNDGDAQ